MAAQLVLDAPLMARRRDAARLGSSLARYIWAWHQRNSDSCVRLCLTYTGRPAAR